VTLADQRNGIPHQQARLKADRARRNAEGGQCPRVFRYGGGPGRLNLKIGRTLGIGTSVVQRGCSENDYWTGLICLEYRLEPACRRRIIRGMETTVGRVLAVLLYVVTAVTAALTAGYTARYDLGFSPQQTRTQAVIVAIVIGLLLAIEHYGKKLRKPK
jgi:hypothetical protein